MSVLIKGMEIPKRCNECRFLEGDNMDGLCHAAERWMDDEDFKWYVYEEDGDVDTDKPANCPLIEVPDHRCFEWIPVTERFPEMEMPKTCCACNLSIGSCCAITGYKPTFEEWYEDGAKNCPLGDKTVITIPVNSDFEEIIISAERYAFGRATYIVGSTADYITNILPYLSDKCLFVMNKDMKSGFELYERLGKSVGMKIDHERWQRFAKGIEKEIERRRGGSVTEDDN